MNEEKAKIITEKYVSISREDLIKWAMAVFNLDSRGAGNYQVGRTLVNINNLPKWSQFPLE